MVWIRLFVVLVLALVGHHWWQKHGASALAAVRPSVHADPGFVDLPQPTGTNPWAVLIVSAPNCPSAESQRARALSRALAERGIAHVSTGTVDFDLDSREAATRVQRIMTSGGPIVIFHGRAKVNPSLDEVLAEYDAARR